MYPRRGFLACCALATMSLGGLWYPSRARAQVQSDDHIHFLWLFEAKEKRQPGDAVHHFAITQDTELKAGDELRMAVELRKPCYVYVLYHSAQGDIKWLFPYDKQQFDTNYTTEKKYPIPPGGDTWFTLTDKAGKETFYVLASSKRLSFLEILLETYAVAPAAERAPLVAQIVTTIRTLKRQNRQLASPAERPIPIAGNMRHDVQPTEITAPDFYSKTFTIDTTE